MKRVSVWLAVVAVCIAEGNIAVPDACLSLLLLLTVVAEWESSRQPIPANAADHKRQDSTKTVFPKLFLFGAN